MNNIAVTEDEELYEQCDELLFDENVVTVFQNQKHIVSDRGQLIKRKNTRNTEGKLTKDGRKVTCTCGTMYVLLIR